MQMIGEQRIAAPCQKVWAALNDPAVLRDSIPGCQSLEQESAERLNATIEVKVGPIGARFKGSVTLTDINAPHGYTLIIEGNGGIAGSAKGTAKVSLTEIDGGTLITYTVDADVGGRMAQLGGPIIDATAKQLAAKFFSRFGDIVSGVKTAAITAPDQHKSNGSSDNTSNTSANRPAVATAANSAWMGIAIGLLLILVAGAAFEYGRHTVASQHAPQIIVLSPAQLQQLIESQQANPHTQAPRQHDQPGAN